MIKEIVNRAVAGAVAAGAALVAIIAFGATVFYLLSMVLLPVGAAAATAALFAIVAGVAYIVFAKKAAGEDDVEEEDEEPETMPAKLLYMVQQRPMIGIVAALGAGAILLKKPGLAALAMTAFNESRNTPVRSAKGRHGNSKRSRSRR